MGLSRRSVGKIEGTKVLEGALRRFGKSGLRIGDDEPPRAGTVIPGPGLCEMVVYTDAALLNCRIFLDDRLSGMIDKSLPAWSGHC